MEEIEIDISIEQYILSLNMDGIQLLYYWNYGRKIIKCYGLYIDNYSNINSHSLPPNGISSILDEDSDNIILSDNIYICAFDKNDKLTNYYISDYGDFYYVMNEQNQFDTDNPDEDDLTITDNTSIIYENKDMQNIIHNNNNNLDYDNNIY
jgi:hypothetical protein